MTILPASSPSSAGAAPMPNAGARLFSHAYWLFIAALSLLVLGLMALVELQSVLNGQYPGWQFNNGYYAAYLFSANLLTKIVFVAIAIFIAVRRWNDWMVLLMSLALLMTAVYVPNSSSLLTPLLPTAEGDALRLALLTYNDVLLLTLLLMFPDGRFQPRRGWALVALQFAALLAVRVGNWNPGALPLLMIDPGFLLLGIGAQVYRYRRVSSDVQRQQGKWMLAGALLLVLAVLVDELLRALVAETPATLPLLFAARSIVYLGLVALAGGLMLGILRYRLYDVDLVIHRSVVYGSASLVLFGTLVGLALVFQQVAGEQAVPLTVASGLALGLVFNPLRRRMQRLIDLNVYQFRADLDQLERPKPAPPPQSPGLLTGQTAGRWTLEHVLGSGGMGEVYLARDGGGTRAAVKVMTEALLHDPGQRRRFEGEAAVLRALAHPGVVRVLDVGALAERLYMAMELLEGELLSAVLKARTRLPLGEALPIVQQLAAALDYVHAQGVIHRDVKPGNVILCGARAVLTDFGLARAQGDGRSQLTTGLAGTLDYAAPEQILVACDIDRRADVYGLGVTVYQLLTGELPFKGGVGNVLFAHLHQPAPDLCAAAPHIPLRVSLAVQVAMSKDPAARYDSAGEFAAALAAGR